MHNAILASYKRGVNWGLTPQLPDKRPLNEEEQQQLYFFNQILRDKLPQLAQKGMCIPFHRMVCQCLRSCGIESEIVYGDLEIDGNPNWNVTVKELKRQLKAGISDKAQRIHCWLILPDHSFVDFTICNDLWLQPEVLHTKGVLSGEGHTYRYVPLLMGASFIEKTNKELTLSPTSY